MSFRRQKDDWGEFVRKHGQEILACGVPDYVFAKRMRFLVFLEHGFDEWGWAENHHAFFDSKSLSDDQVSQLAVLVRSHIDDSYGNQVDSWLRQRS